MMDIQDKENACAVAYTLWEEQKKKVDDIDVAARQQEKLYLQTMIQVALTHERLCRKKERKAIEKYACVVAIISLVTLIINPWLSFGILIMSVVAGCGIYSNEKEKNKENYLERKQFFDKYEAYIPKEHKLSWKV